MTFRGFKGERIFTPGPVEIPDSVRKVLGSQIIHHRTPEFTQSFLETRRLFKELVKSNSENFVFFASSGTGAMEASVQNFFKEGDKVIAVVGGKFGERWSLLGKRWGLRVIDLNVEWGKSVDVNALEDLLKEHTDVKGILVQMSESSTGAFHDVFAIGELTKNRDTLLVVDAITALGVYDLDLGSSNIDVVVGGSQKAFMLPPGLSILWFSEKARERLTGRAFYFNVTEELKKQKEGQTAWTPAITFILALREVLKSMLEEGMESIERKYRAISKGIGAFAEKVGFRILPQNPSISLSVLVPPKGVDADSLRKTLLRRYGIRVAGGQGKLKGKIVRISHMGMGPLDITEVLCAMEMALKDAGTDLSLGDGVKEYLNSVYSDLK